MNNDVAFRAPAREEGFYIYVYCDPRPGKNEQPIYVGKGVRYRAHSHWRDAERHPNRMMRYVLSKILKAGLSPIIKIFGYFEDEAEAYRLEIGLIAKIGRRDLGTGSLCNLSSGGSGVSDSPATVAATRKRHADPELKMIQIQGLRRVNSDRELARKQHAVDPEFKKAKADRRREASSKRMREYNADPNVKAALRKRNSSPERIARIAAGRLKYFADPENIKARSERARKRMADPEFRAKVMAGLAKYHARKRRSSLNPLAPSPPAAPPARPRTPR